MSASCKRRKNQTTHSSKIRGFLVKNFLCLMQNCTSSKIPNKFSVCFSKTSDGTNILTTIMPWPDTGYYPHQDCHKSSNIQIWFHVLTHTAAIKLADRLSTMHSCSSSRQTTIFPLIFKLLVKNTTSTLWSSEQLYLQYTKKLTAAHLGIPGSFMTNQLADEPLFNW
jgi:hypothetical protein